MTEPCMCGADDCPACFPDSQWMREPEIDDPEPVDFDPGDDPTLGNGYYEPRGWP